MKLTKKDMVKVILQALWNRKKLPKEEGIWMKRINRVMMWSKEEIKHQYNLAIKILKAREN